jgi:hypothetical protein
MEGGLGMILGQGRSSFIAKNVGRVLTSCCGCRQHTEKISCGLQPNARVTDRTYHLNLVATPSVGLSDTTILGVVADDQNDAIGVTSKDYIPAEVTHDSSSIDDSV